MGDIRELLIVVVFLVIGLFISIMAVSRVPMLAALHPILKIAIVFAGGFGITFGIILAWGAVAELMRLMRRKPPREPE